MNCKAVSGDREGSGTKDIWVVIGHPGGSMSLELCNKDKNFGGPLKRMAKQRKLAPSKAGNLSPRDPGRRDREGGGALRGSHICFVAFW